MAANNMSNTHVSPEVLSTLMLLQQGNLHKLHQTFCMASAEVVVLRCSIKKLLLKLTQNLQENTCVGASFEKLLQHQLVIYIKNYLSPHLCGYRKGYSSQQALISLIENWKKSLDKKGYGGAVLMDLSKAFDTIKHDLLLAKLHAYGFSKKH